MSWHCPLRREKKRKKWKFCKKNINAPTTCSVYVKFITQHIAVWITLMIKIVQILISNQDWEKLNKIVFFLDFQAKVITTCSFTYSQISWIQFSTFEKVINTNQLCFILLNNYGYRLNLIRLLSEKFSLFHLLFFIIFKSLKKVIPIDFGRKITATPKRKYVTNQINWTRHQNRFSRSRSQHGFLGFFHIKINYLSGKWMGN